MSTSDLDEHGRVTGWPSHANQWVEPGGAIYLTLEQFATTEGSFELVQEN